MPRPWHDDQRIHRTLRVFGVPQAGEDIKQLQRDLNERSRARNLGQQVAEDGMYGPMTRQLAHDVAYAYGAAAKYLRLEGFGQGLQRIVRNPGRRTPAQRRRDRRRRSPRLITARQAGLTGFQYLWGGKGAVFRGAGHYTAGPRATSDSRLVELARTYHRMHGGGLAYEYFIGDNGTILLGNLMDRKSAGVAMNNTGLVNVCCPGTTGDLMTPAQVRSVRWLMANAHTRRVPAPHRAPAKLTGLSWLGHKEYPSNSTACPGDMLPQYKEIW